MTRETLEWTASPPAAKPGAGTLTWVLEDTRPGHDVSNEGCSMRRLYLDSFFERQLAGLTGRVLDVGGRKAVKRGGFNLSRAPGCVTYLNLDPVTRPDVCCNAQQLAVRDASCDHVVCAELIEHVPDPRQLLRELARVLRPGGRLYLTAPFLYRIHEDPADYARYTDAGLRELLADAGFTVVAIYRQGLLPSVVADALKQAVEHGVLGRSWLGRRVWWRVARWTQRRTLALERRPSAVAHPFLQSFTTGFAVIAETPRTEPEGAR